MEQHIIFNRNDLEKLNAGEEVVFDYVNPLNRSQKSRMVFSVEREATQKPEDIELVFEFTISEKDLGVGLKPIKSTETNRSIKAVIDEFVRAVIGNIEENQS